MNLHSLNMILAEATNAAGTPTPPLQQSEQAKMVSMISTLAIMAFLFYFLLIRPQSKKAKEQATMLKSVKPGDKVVTSSGIVGTVVAVKDKTISLRSAETKLEVLKSAVTDITERSGETAES